MVSPALPLIALGAAAAAGAGLRSALVPAPDPVAPLLLAGGTGLLLAGLFLIGSGSRRGRRWAALLAALGVGGALATLVVLHGSGTGPEPGTRLILGLPPGAALAVYGLGLLPVLVVPLAFTLTETGTGLDPDALDGLRRDAATAVPDTDAAEGCR
jgi:hypothetical protein